MGSYGGANSVKSNPDYQSYRGYRDSIPYDGYGEAPMSYELWSSLKNSFGYNPAPQPLPFNKSSYQPQANNNVGQLYNPFAGYTGYSPINYNFNMGYGGNPYGVNMYQANPYLGMTGQQYGQRIGIGNYPSNPFVMNRGYFYGI